MCKYIVETKGKTLEETAALFDGEEVTDKLASAGARAVHAHEHKEEHLDSEKASQ